MDSASRWLVGSSSNSKSGCAASARHSATRRFSPPDSGPTRVVNGGARERRRGGLDARLQIPSVHRFDLVLQLRHLRIRARAGFILSQPLHEVRRSSLDVFPHRHAAIQLKFLRQITDAQSPAPRHLPGIRALLAGENSQQTRLSAPVPAHQADLLARRDRQRNLFQQTLVSIRQREVIRRQQSRSRNIHHS